MELFVESSSNLVFIDSSVSDYDTLAAGIGSDFETIILEGDQNGIEQITEILTQKSNVESVHIISHGSLGSLQLGDSTLNSDNLDDYIDPLTSWSDHLSEDADILLYGCDFGKDGDLVEQLANLTGADIAASDDLTGNSDLGGDWDLEVQMGEIEADLALSNAAIANFDGILNDPVLPNDPNFVSEVAISDLNEPVSLMTLPDGRLLILEKEGVIKIADPSDTTPTTSDYLVLPNILSSGEKGLIDITLDPEFETNGHFYVYYSPASTEKFQISRFTHQGNTADLSSETVIWQDPEVASRPSHFGGEMGFGRDGKLYILTGDKFSATRSQDLSSPAGKVLRFNKDGSIPADNPFIGVPDALPEIWAVGLRNPFSGYWSDDGVVTFGDVSQDTREEINQVVISEIGGKNFGWPNYEGDLLSGDPLEGEELIFPAFAYNHNDRGGAAIGGVTYEGTQFPSEFQGAFFFADFAQNFIKYLKFDTDGNVIDADLSTPELDAFSFDERVRQTRDIVAFEEGIDGSLYYLQYQTSTPDRLGALNRISYNSSGNQVPVITQAVADQELGASPLTVNFSGVATDAENDPLTYRWIFGDGSEATGNNVSHVYTSNGLYEVTLSVSDGTNTTLSDPITITAGTPPTATITSPLEGTSFRAGDIITFTGNGTDPDGILTAENLEWTVRFIHEDHNHPELSGLTGSSGSFEIETTGHDYSDFTGYEITLTVTDADGLKTTDVVSVFPEKVNLTFDTNLPNDDSVVFTLDDIPQTGSFIYDTAINFQHEVSVPSNTEINGIPYIFDSWSAGSSTLGTTPTLNLSVPETNQTYIANYIVNDPNPDPEPPVANNDSVSIVTNSQNNALDVLSNDTDPDPGDTFTITEVSSTSNGGSVSINPSNDGLIYSPDTGFIGNETLTYTIADSTGLTSTAQVSIDVAELSSVPVTNGLVLQLDANSGVSTDSSGIVTGWTDQSGVGNDLTSIGGDPTLVTDALNGNNVIRLDGDGDKLERLIDINLPAGNGNRSVFMVAKYNGTGDGGFSYGTSSTDKTFGLTVRRDGDLQVKAWGRSGDADSNIDGTGQGWLSQSVVLADSTMNHYKDGTLIDTKNHVYDTTLEKVVLGADIDSSPFVDMEVAEVLVFDRALSETERQQVENYLQQKYFSSSPGGGNSGGGNTAPVAVNDSATTSQGTGVTINVLSNDSDGDGDPLELSIFNNPSLGIAVVDDGGTPNDLTDDLIRYTPNASSTGDDSFTYQVNDGNGGTDTATVSVNISSIGGLTNTPPSASVDSFTVNEDSSNNVLNVLANDTDPEIERGSGSVDFSGYTIETANDKVLKVFDTVSSGGLENATLVFDATDTGGTAPHFMNPPSSAPEFLTMHNVGGNGPQINFTMTRQDGLAFGFKSFKYTSDAFFQAGGNDLNAGFTVIGTTVNGEQVTQAFGPANTTQVFQTATLTGEQWNNLVSVRFVGDRIAEGTELTQSLNIDDIEVTAPALTIDSVTSGDQGGTLTVNSSSDGLLYTPEADFTGTETFEYTVNDGNGGTDTATVTMTVNNVNDDAPTAANDNLNIAVNSSNNTLDVLANDTDPDPGDTFTITEVSTTSNGGSVSINANNDRLIYTPVNDFSGSETFTYTIADSTGLTSTAEVSIDVAESGSNVPVLDGLVMQLDASQGVTTDISGVVTAWTDLSGAGNNLTTSTGDPTVIAEALNGHSVVRFDGDGDKLERLIDVNLPAGNANRSVFMVANYISPGDGGLSYGTSSTDKTFGLTVRRDGDLQVKAWGRSGDADSNVDGTGEDWLSQSVVLADSTMNHYKDGDLIDTKNHVYDTTLEKVVLGADIDSSPFVEMEVAEVLVFDRALSEAERQQVDNYLQQKYFAV